MSTPYTIKINGASAVTMQSLGLAFGALELLNMGVDSASLRWMRRRASEACPLAFNDTVEIFRSERRLFRGRARIGTRTEEGAAIKIVGPWSHLEEHTVTASLYSASVNSLLGPRPGDTVVINYIAGTVIATTGGGSYTVPPGPDLVVTWTWGYTYSYTGGATVGVFNINLSRTGRFWLFRPGGTVGQVYTTLADQFDALMDHAAWVMNPDLWTVGTKAFGGTVVPKARTVADATLADCVKQCLAMKPDAAIWWDYSGADVPVLNARVASLETATELTVGTRSGQALQGFSLTALDELVPEGVIVRWEGDADASSGVGVASDADVYPTTTSPTSQRVLTHTVERETPYVSGLAQEVYTSLAVRRAQGQLMVVDPDFSLGLRPGAVLSLAGEPDLAGIQLWVQGVSWSPSDGLARLSVGYPAHLNLRDRVDLRGWLRWSFNGPHFSTVQIVPA